MTQYRGYYIDGVTFNGKRDIDVFIKENNVKHMKTLLDMMHNSNDPMYIMAVNNRLCDTEHFLHDECGMSWDEIEELEAA